MLKNAFNKISIQSRALNASSLRQDIISNNIANVDTPGYKRKDLVFSDIFNEFLDETDVTMTRTHEKHFGTTPDKGYYVSTSNDFDMRIDGNNVNPDYEMAELAKNQIKYNAMVSEVSAQFRRLRSAIRGGR